MDADPRRQFAKDQRPLSLTVYLVFDDRKMRHQSFGLQQAVDDIRGQPRNRVRG